MPLAIVGMAAAWLLTLIYDIVSGGWDAPPGHYGIWRLALPLFGFLPTALRLLTPEREPARSPYVIFKRLALTALVAAGAMLVAGLIPHDYTPLVVPVDFASFIIGRIIGLIAMITAPLLAEGVVLIFHYRNRGNSTPKLPRIFTWGLLLSLLAGEFLPMSSSSEDGAAISSIAYGIASALGMFGFILATRGGWIVNLRKKQKLGLLGLSFIGTPAASALISIVIDSDTGRALISIAPAFSTLLLAVGLAMLLTCMAIFVSALFALPTADAIDRRNMEVSSLANFARLLTQSLDSGDLINTAIAIACEAMSGNAAWIELKQGEEYVIHTGENPRAPAHVIQRLIDSRATREFSLAQAVRHYRRVEVVDNVSGATWGAKGAGQVIRSVAAAPLLLGGEHRGTLYVAKERPDGFDREESVVLNALADQIAIAMEHSALIQTSIERERFEQEMLIAQDLQQRLLPKVMPISPFYELYAESLPASLVGGDYYDVVVFSDQTLGILIADVSGKGASAALYMGMIKGIMQALSGRCANPRELLAQANVALHGSIDQRWFATMTCAQIIEETRTLRIARAGHCPTLLLRDGAGCYSRPRGLGLAIAKPGLFDNNLEIEDVSFSSGDYAIFYSDGLPEARSGDGEEYGYERLLRTACDGAAAGMSAHAMRDAIFEEIGRFSEGEPQGDDSTLVILRWR
jgi:serine phosphatase RsbU (regulator of sigma subunit)